jgi:hypothetical protein
VFSCCAAFRLAKPIENMGQEFRPDTLSGIAYNDLDL